MISIAMLCFAINVSAGVVFRSQQSVCANNEQIIFKSNGVCQMWQNSTLLSSGTYTIEGNIIIMYFEGGAFRGRAEMNSSKTQLRNFTFNNVKYYPCR